MKNWRQVPASAMAIFSPNSVFLKPVIHLQSRPLPVLWAEKKVGCIKCSSEGRDFSTSFPVRYIPRKNLDSRESEGLISAKERSYGAKEHSNSDAHRVDFSRNAFILESVETKGQDRANEDSRESEGLSSSAKERSYGANEHLNSDAQRVDFSRNAFILESVETKGQDRANESVNFDVGSRVREDFNRDEFFEDDNILEEPEEVMQEMEVSDGKEQNENNELQGSGIQQDVENLAVEMLAKRAFTAAELRKKLLGKHFPRVIVDAVIMDFQKRGFVNDSLYAETYSRSRWSTSTWGPWRIKKALLGKGVNSEDAEKAVRVVLNDTKSTKDEESMFGMSQQSMDHLFVQASKQWHRSGNVPRETQKSRIIRWLQYRGFSWSIISVVLKKLESGDRL